jgi:hypothetical protein
MKFTSLKQEKSKIRAFRYIAPCSLGVHRRFRGAYCPHHQGDDSLIMEAVRASETSVYFSETIRRYVTEISNLHTRRRENLSYHKEKSILRKSICFNLVSFEGGVTVHRNLIRPATFGSHAQ